MKRRLRNVKTGDVDKICAVTSASGDVYPVAGYDKISSSIKLRATCFVILDDNGEPDDLFVSWDARVYMVGGAR